MVYPRSIPLHNPKQKVTGILKAIIKNTKMKQQEKAEANFDRSSKARRNVMDVLSTYHQLLSERKRKTQITLDALIKRQKIGNTEDTA
ncbi:hypothetical protein TNCV_117731 [Trichonephila clavipes]|nr:hypothetical protein TNCV_117731 [Trichonephila clavipes]